MTTIFKDWRGTEIKVGSKVVYPSRSGSSLEMHEALVEDIQPNTDRWRQGDFKVKTRRIDPDTWARWSEKEHDYVQAPEGGWRRRATWDADAGRVTVVG